MKTLISILAIMWMGMMPVLSQSVSASADKKALSLREVFTYTVTITNGNGRIELPEFGPFQVVRGPSIQNMQSVVNGKLTKQYSESYVLRPLKAGKWGIPPAYATLNGKRIASNKIVVDVVESAANAEQINNAEKFFARISMSKAEVYEGEPIWVSYQVFTAYNDVRNWKMDYEEIDGFWSEECEPDNNLVAKNVNGRRLLNAEARRLLLFPQRSGELKLNPFKVDADRVVGGFFNRSKEVISTTSNGRTIKVKPLPPGKPDHFIGTYLDYELKAKVNKTESPSNEAINVTITASGRGNMKVVNEPEIQWPEDFEVYDPKQTDNIEVTRVSESGRRTFEYVVIPRSAGQFVIPPVKQAWFNPSSGSYEVASTQEIRLNISQGNESDLGGIFDGASVVQSEVTRLNKDIRYIKTAASVFEGKKRSFFGSAGYWISAGLPLFLLLGFAFVRKRKIESESDEEGSRKKRAAKVARKYLAQAQSMVGESKSSFYDTLNQSLMGYLADKLSIPQSDFNQEHLSKTLSGKLAPEDVTEVLGLVDACHEARYSPISKLSPEEALERTKKVIEKLERS